MQVSNNYGTHSAANNSGSAKNASDIDAKFNAMLSGDDPAEMLGEMTKDGVSSLWKWQMKQLEKKVAAQVMAEMHITKDSLGKMSVEERAATEETIMKEVARRIKDIVKEGVEKKTGITLGGGAGVQPAQDTAQSLDIFA